MAIFENIQQKNMMEGAKSGVLRKFPLLGATLATLNFEANSQIPTAATDGEKIIYNPEFIKSLTYDERIFTIAHEVMHDAFDHILRSKNKDPQTWNIACDAVVNQLLKQAGLPLKEVFVDMPEALGKSAEQMYEIIKQQQGNQENSSQNDQKNQENSDQDSSQNNQENEQENSQNNQNCEQENCQDFGKNQGVGQHTFWQDAVEKAEQKEENSGQNSEQKNAKQCQDLEKNFTEMNDQMKQELGGKIIKKLSEDKQKSTDSARALGGYTSQFNGVGEGRAVVSWKKILKRELDKEIDAWSYRRADDENDFQARIESFDVQDFPETEVMLDVSGSVDDNFLKGFLRQLKPLLKQSKLKVGCFDNQVYNFVEIKNMHDIDHFRVERKEPWTENWDAAVRAFSKKKGVNRIVFTDGVPGPGNMPKADLSKTKVIWLVFSNPDFKPCCGKVVFINKQELDAENKRTNPERSM